ncbi:hypothetical protein L1887_36322 [Cichorium endivia]|nr:hypothetical protein L1887_36322 [Cichorium endivia]
MPSPELKNSTKAHSRVDLLDIGIYFTNSKINKCTHYPFPFIKIKEYILAQVPRKKSMAHHFPPSIILRLILCLS